MPAPLLNLKVAAITDTSNPSSKYEFVGLFGSCSFCVHVILSGIHMQKNKWFYLFLSRNVCLLGIVSILWRKQTISSYAFTAHSMVVSLLNRGSGSKNEQ